MRVVHVSTFERTGGAAIAASRLHTGLLALGCESTLLVRDRTPDDPTPGALLLDAGVPSISNATLAASLYSIYQRYRDPGVDTLFSTDLPTRRIVDLPSVQAADVVNVHWTAGMMSVPAIRAVQDLGKPVVWTLHDHAAFTGGCHYSGSCRQYEVACDTCPQLIPDARHVPALVLSHKRRWLDPDRLTVVCPSAWMTDCARRSALLRTVSVETILNGVPVALYQQRTRADARATVGLPEGAIVLLAGGHRLDENRKGYAHLRGALARLVADPAMRRRFERGELVCVAFGEGETRNDWPIRHLGRLVGDEQLSVVYRAADVFVLPTLEDNLPNTLVESVAAGTPVVAYDTGGVPDVLRVGRCGLLAPHGDVDALAASVRTLIDDAVLRQRLGAACESHARAALDTSVQAEAYARLYERLLRDDPPRRRRAPRQDAGLERDEAGLLAATVSAPALATRLLQDLTAELDAHQQLIAARGGEIVALRAGLDATLTDWRMSRETLHQAEQRLTALAATGARMAAERAALLKRLRRRMTRVAIWGSDDHARRLWEALSLGGADVVAFIDDHPRRQGRAFLGARIHPTAWLTTAGIDVVAVSDADLSRPAVRAVLAFLDGSQVLPLPSDASDDTLARLVAAHLPDPLRDVASGAPPSDVLRVGVFGTGSAAMKVWEALAEMNEAEVVWFADNNPRQQGQPLLWLDVIAPALIPSRACDVIVIGSMSRDAIGKQLCELGIPAERILAPDVAAATDEIRRQLSTALAARLEEVAR